MCLFTQWTEEHTKAFEKKYESEWQPPPGVQLLQHTEVEEEEEERFVDVTDEVAASRAGMLKCTMSRP